MTTREEWRERLRQTAATHRPLTPEECLDPGDFAGQVLERVVERLIAERLTASAVPESEDEEPQGE